MTTRRTFISTVSTAAASMLAFNPAIFAGTGGQKLKNIGFISGIIGKELEGDWKTVLKKTVTYGFSEIEPGNYLGESAASFLAFCKEIGLKPCAKGISFNAKEAVLKKELESINELDIKYAILYWPWLVGGPFGLEDCKKSADILNKTGKICRENGLTLCW